ncbi:S-layer homology domain-containing protein [Psychrobacillus sp. FSL H8-0483]|uniref:S-layer homology domain-containing protein n=1 Tax=Psychrobacillus sp. FSL H8-0483 TaxID=2921389 RepID=UPI003159D218
MRTIYILLFSILFMVFIPNAYGNVLAASDTTNKIQEVTMDAKFTDVSDAYWAKNEIMQLVDMGIMTGDRDLQFRPDLFVTVEEAEVVLTKAFKLEPHMLRNYLLGDKKDFVTMKQVEAALEHAINVTETEENNSSLLEGKSELVSLLSTPSINKNNFSNLNNTIDRATFAVMLHEALVKSGAINTIKNYSLKNLSFSNNYSPLHSEANLMKVSFDEHPIYLRSTENIVFTNHTRIDNSFSRDNDYTYDVGMNGATIELTVRSFDNGDYFLFSKIDNPTNSAVAVDVIQKENQVDSLELFRYDRYEIKRSSKDVFGSDITSYPTGLLRFVKQDGTVEERMVGQSYISKQLSLTYPNNGQSYMRDLLAEKEALSYAQVGETLMSIHTLESEGKDIVEQWYLNADNPLFSSNEHMENWMLESSENYKKRNKWYTADGQYSKMATTTEPMPESGQGYGRILLLQKEDRALVLYNQQKDRYFENLIYNSFVNLKNFKGDKGYWETEVTSTYLKSLYEITAPFIDTRFNEQIALFYYNSADAFGIENGKEPLRNYADLLVSQKSKGNVIPVDDESYYISDYFPVVQDTTTHASMNHVLGGMNILLMAYNEFHDEKYLEAAHAIQTAIAKDKDDWIRDNGDIWYRISPVQDYKGDDYKHLTLEDLINSYKLWKDIDPTYLPLLEEMIASKASYLSNENLGYTSKIKNGLADIGLMQYLPVGNEQTDAL